MLNESEKNIISNNISNFFDFKEEFIFNRPNLGDFNFEILKDDYNIIYKLLEKFKNKNYILIFPNQSADLNNRIMSLLETMNIIKSFYLSEGNKANERADLINRFTDQVYNISVVMGPLLAYLDVVDPSPSEIEKLKRLSEELERTAKEKLQQADKLYAELTETLNAARNASATIGSIPFSRLFNDKSDEQKKSANNWLWATSGFALLTVVFAIFTFFYFLSNPLTDNSNWAIYNLLSSKIILFAVFIGGTVWCGRIYKALKHQEAVNSHRATAIQTFETFIAAANKDEGTKQAVLLETTRAIFSHTDTGLIPNSDSGGSETKIIELLKSVPATH